MQTLIDKLYFAKPLTLPAAQTATVQCNYTNNYYGDQVCFLVNPPVANVIKK